MMTGRLTPIAAFCVATLAGTSVSASPMRAGGLLIEAQRAAGGAPSVVSLTASPSSPQFAAAVALAGPVSVESRRVENGTIEFVFAFDQALLAYRRVVVEGADELATYFTPGESTISVTVAGVQDASHLKVGVVDVVSDTGLLPYAEARLGVLTGDLSQDGAVEVEDINEFVRAYVINDPRADLDLSGSNEPDDISLFVDSYLDPPGPLENLAPSVEPLMPIHATPGGESLPVELIVRDDATPTEELQFTVESGNASIVAPADVLISTVGDATTLRVRGSETAQGSTTVTVNVSDGERTGQTAFLVTVGPDQPPTAIIDSSAHLGVSPLTIDFDASESQDAQDNIVAYEWDLGDGVGGVGTALTHTFTAPGHYPVTLTVRDASGLEHTATRVITVAPSAYVPGGAVSEEEARRFLWQAAWGPGQGDVDFVMQNGFEAWIDAQLAVAPSYITDELIEQLDALDGRWADPSDIWEDHCIQGPDQLRQRLAWALIQIIAIRSGNDQNELYNLYVKNALGDPSQNRAGNYREMLVDITYNAEMGEWLTYAGNKKADDVLGTKPDENYAREIMQLFTIGLWMRDLDGRLQHDVFGDPIPTYDTQEDVAQFARIFTGLRRDWPSPVMVVNVWNHEFGDKHLLDYPGAMPASGYVPASEFGELAVHDDIDMAIDNLFYHPSTAPFIAELLIKRLVTSNPTHAYIERVAQAFEGSGPYGSGTRGDMGATVKAILLDDEARNPAYRDNPFYGKVREPLVAVLGSARALGMVEHPGVPYPFQNDYGTGGGWVGDQLGQRWLGTPSVFNFYQPDYAPLNTALSAGGYAAPELQILDDRTALSLINRLGYDIADDQDEWDPVIFAQVSALVDDAPALVDELDMILNAGQTDGASKAIIADAVDRLPRDEWRIGAAAHLILSGPGFRVQR